MSFTGIYEQIKGDCEKVMEEIKQELKNIEDGSAYLLKIGDGKIEGDLEITDNLKCDDITDTNRKQSSL